MEVRCPKCGAPMEDGHCGYCGYIEKKPDNMQANVNNIPQQTMQPQDIQTNTFSNNSASNSSDTTIGVSMKSKTIALKLCLFFGWCGAHRFYVGDLKKGILYFFTVGLFCIGWWIDLVLIVTGSFKDSSGLPLRQ